MSADPLAGAERVELRHGVVAMLVLRPAPAPLPLRFISPLLGDEPPWGVITEEEAKRLTDEWRAPQPPSQPLQPW